MTRTAFIPLTFALAAVLLAAGCGGAEAGRSADGPSADADRARAAERMIQASRSRLAPVYAPLAEHLVAHLDLADAEGVGIDVGGGPGTLVVELATRTRMHWVNADINPHFFAPLYRRAEAAGVAHRVSAVRADARRLPFRSDWARAVVSRGSFHFWGGRDDRKRGLAEIYRVLAPGGVAYIGRGFSPNLPVETARRIRAGQGKTMQYDRRELGRQLAGIMKELGIADYTVHLPDPPGAKGFHYGVWIEFRKPEAE